MKDNLIKAKFNLPNSWNIGVLENLTNQIVDGTHFTPKYTESGMPFLRVTDVQTKEINFEKIKFISLQEHEMLKKRCNPSKGDLLVSKNGTIGIPKIVDWDWEFSIFVSLALIKLKRDLDINYLYHFFKSDIFQWQIIRRAKQGTVTNLHLEEIRELEIPLLSLPQQKKIAKILSTCDEVIEKTEAAIAKYKAIKQGMMHDLFTRGIDTTTGKLRPSYQEAPELYKESALGMIPSLDKDGGNLIKEKFNLPLCWKIDILENLTTQIVDGTHFTPKYTESGIPFLRVTDVQTKEINFEKIRFVSFEEHIILKNRCNPSKGDLLLSKNGTIGIPKIVDWDWEFSIFVSLALIKVKKELDVSYLYHFFKSDIFQWQIIRRAKQGTVTNLHLEEIRELEIPLLPIAEQQKIAEILNNIDEKLQAEESALQKYKKIKEGLMQDLLTGRVVVSD